MATIERTIPTPSPWREQGTYRRRLVDGALGQFQREKNPFVLKTYFQRGIEARFSPQEQQLLLATYDLMMELHQEEPLRRTDADARTHMARVAIIGLFDEKITKQGVAVRLLHDSIEDLERVTQESLHQDLRTIGWEDIDARVIAGGAQVMSMIDGDHKLPPDEYEAKILAMHKNHPELHLIELKKDDRADNTRDDCSRLLDGTVDPSDLRGIYHYWAGKAQRAENLPGKRTPSHRRLHEARKLCAQELGKRQPVEEIIVSFHAQA